MLNLCILVLILASVNGRVPGPLQKLPDISKNVIGSDSIKSQVPDVTTEITSSTQSNTTKKVVGNDSSHKHEDTDAVNKIGVEHVSQATIGYIANTNVSERNILDKKAAHDAANNCKKSTTVTNPTKQNVVINLNNKVSEKENEISEENERRNVFTPQLEDDTGSIKSNSLLSITESSQELRNITETAPLSDKDKEKPATVHTIHVNSENPLIFTQYIDQGQLEEARNASVVNSTLFLGFKSYSGFLTVDKRYQSNTFFWYFPVEGKVEEAPWIIWLQGGPGASSLFGLFDEFGPFTLDNEGVLSNNPYTWLQNHSLVFIDNPIGAGFSYTMDKKGSVKSMETYSAHLYEATRQLLLLFPELQRAPLYVAGESYAGKYVPSLALELHKHKGEIQVNLQGIMLGNALTERFMTLSSQPWLHSGLLDADEARAIQPSIDAYYRRIEAGEYKEAIEKYNIIGNFVNNHSNQTNLYNYLLDEDRTSSDAGKMFFENHNVRTALHVGKRRYKMFNTRVFITLLPEPSEVRPKIEILLEHYRVLAYCGNLDMALPCVNAAEVHRTWNWTGKPKFLSAARQTYWFDDSVVGHYKTGGNFTEAVIYGAGHMVPTDKPAIAQGLITKWTHDETLSIKPVHYLKIILDSPHKNVTDVNVTNETKIIDNSTGSVTNTSGTNQVTDEVKDQTTELPTTTEISTTEADINNEIINYNEEQTLLKEISSDSTKNVTNETQVPENESINTKEVPSVSTTSETNQLSKETKGQNAEIPTTTEMSTTEADITNEIIKYDNEEPKLFEENSSDSTKNVTNETQVPENESINTKEVPSVSNTSETNQLSGQTAEIPTNTEMSTTEADIKNETIDDNEEPKRLEKNSNVTDDSKNFIHGTQIPEKEPLNNTELTSVETASEGILHKKALLLLSSNNGNSSKLSNETKIPENTSLKPTDQIVYLRIASDDLNDETNDTSVSDDSDEMPDPLTETKPLILTPYLREGMLEQARNASEVNSTSFLGLKSYSGFFTVNETYNSNTFFWYFPVEGKLMEEVPWIIWLQGGPGISSILGLVTEIGPFSVDSHGLLSKNPNSWLQNYSLVFIDNPVGCGFSFTEHEDGYAKDMATYSKHLYSATRQLVTLFPELQRAPLYVAGESYGGKYVPSLALELHRHRKEIQVNLKGIIVGNGYIDPVLLSNFSRASYNLGLLTPEDVQSLREDEARYDLAVAVNNSPEAKDFWVKILVKITDRTRLRQVYNFLHSNSIVGDLLRCNAAMERLDIRRAIHVGHVRHSVYNFTAGEKLRPEFLTSAKAKYEELMEHYKVLLYCGQLDQMMACGVASEFHRTFDWSGHDAFVKADKMSFKFNGTLAGYHKTGGNLTEALIRGAGHMVPADRGGAIRHFVTRWTQRQPFCSEDEVDQEYCIRSHKDEDLVHG